MKIGNYEIKSDSLNIILNKCYINKKTKKPYSAPIGYYCNIQELLKALIDREIKETELKDLKTVLAKTEELKALIEDLPTTKPFQSVKKAVVIAEMPPPIRRRRNGNPNKQPTRQADDLDVRKERT